METFQRLWVGLVYDNKRSPIFSSKNKFPEEKAVLWYKFTGFWSFLELYYSSFFNNVFKTTKRSFETFHFWDGLRNFLSVQNAGYVK